MDEGQPKIESAWLLISTDDIKLLDSYHAVTFCIPWRMVGTHGLSEHIFTRSEQEYGVVCTNMTFVGLYTS